MRSPSAPQLLAAMYLATPVIQALGTDQLDRRYIGGSTGRALRAREKSLSTDAIEKQALDEVDRAKDQVNGNGSDKTKSKSTKPSETHFAGHGGIVAATLGAAVVGGGLSGAIAQIFKREAGEPAGLVPDPVSEAETGEGDEKNHGLVARTLGELLEKGDGKDKADDKSESHGLKQSNLGIALTSIGGAVMSSIALNTVTNLIKNNKDKNTGTSNTTTPAAAPSTRPAARDVKEPQTINLLARSTPESAIVDILQRSGVAVTSSGLQTIPGRH